MRNWKRNTPKMHALRARPRPLATHPPPSRCLGPVTARLGQLVAGAKGLNSNGALCGRIKLQLWAL